ncbi:MAG TPA: hypothetical protein VLA12_06865, partial [Planctomycetaceae bacterium]|nr:hypothetical protein [Planctomycetaceae bacterium]
MARVNYPPKTGGNASLFVPNQFPESAIPRRLVSASLFLVDQVYRLMMRWKFNSNGLVPIKAAYMRPFIGKNLPAARDALLVSRVMECDFTYVAGRKSYGYLLQPGFRDCHSVECPDPRLACKIRKFREKAERRLLPVHRWLRSHLATLSVDWDIANEVMNELSPDEEFRKSVEDYRDITRESAKRIGREDLTVCAYGRVHTPFTSFPKELRCCIRTSGQPLVGIDLCNSQPLFLGLLVVRYLQQSKQAQYWTRSKVFRQRDRIRYEG